MTATTSLPEHQHDESPRERTGRLVALFVMPFLIVTMMYATYMGTMHDPQPRDLPVAVVGTGPGAADLAAEIEAGADGALAVRTVDSLADLREQMADGEVAGGIRAPAAGGTQASVYTASVTGASQAGLVGRLLAPVAAESGWRVEAVDLAPLPEGDSSGTLVLFAAMGMMLAGYVPLSAMLLGTPNLTRLRRFLPLSLGWSVTMSSLLWLVLGPVVGAIEGHYLAFVGIGTLTIMAVHVCQLLLTKVLGPFAVLLGMLTWVILGMPSSGLATPVQSMPAAFGWLHEVLPLPAAGGAVRSVVYLDGHGLGGHLLVLAGWLVAGLVLAAWKERRSGTLIVGGPALTAPDAPLPALAGGPVRPYRARVLAVLAFPSAIVLTVVTFLGLSLHEPRLDDMPVAVAGSPSQVQAFVDGVEPGLGGTVDLVPVGDEAEARALVEQREVAAAYLLPDAPAAAATLVTAEGAGASQKSVVERVFAGIAAQQPDAAPLRTVDLAPLTGDDGNGTNSMYVGMSWVMAGFLFFAVMRGGAPDLSRTRQLLPLALGWSLGISVWLWFLFDVVIGAVGGHPLAMIGAGTVTVFAVGWAAAVLTRVVGLLGLVPVMVVMLLAGMPASGGGLSVYMVPEVFRVLTDVLPLPAAVDIARSITYFGSEGVGRDLAVIAAWGVGGLLLNRLAVDPWLNRRGARPHAPLGPRHGRQATSAA